MFAAILLGGICGVVGFLPLILGLKFARRATATSNLGMAGSLLLGVLLSLLVLAGSAIICILIARDMALPFVIPEAMGLVIAAIVYGVVKRVRK